MRRIAFDIPKTIVKRPVVGATPSPSRDNGSLSDSGDTLYGGSDDDTLSGGAGKDRLFGVPADDTTTQ
jgi:Ca2+-binding RTX toxin-like protein